MKEIARAQGALQNLSLYKFFKVYCIYYLTEILIYIVTPTMQ